MNEYADIIDHPHYRSKKRPAMSLHDRAAQFSPFAALTGFDDAVEETRKLAEEQLLLSESGIPVSEDP
ncbi:MAG: hypothetical protein K6E50_11220 [Lachnospiraceae bacterium]|nr:hypothetical protein [Lachnospiraceae bacterium]